MTTRAYFFPPSVKFITFAGAPLVWTTFLRNQPSPWLRPRAVWPVLKIKSPIRKDGPSLWGAPTFEGRFLGQRKQPVKVANAMYGQFSKVQSGKMGSAPGRLELSKGMLK